LLGWSAQSPAINTVEVLCLLSLTCKFYITISWFEKGSAFLIFLFYR
jgi:hypothetical protein